MSGKCKRDCDVNNLTSPSLGELAVFEAIALNGPISMSEIRNRFSHMSSDWVKNKISLLEAEGKITRTGKPKFPVFHAVPTDR